MIKTKIKIISVLLFSIIFLYLSPAYAAQSYAVMIKKVNNDFAKHHYEKAFLILRMLADKGNMKAQRKLGFMYDNGYDGFPKNFKKANRWFKLAAEQGDAESQLNVGNAFFCGFGVPKNFKKALYWYKLAVKQGNSADVEGEGNVGSNLYLYETHKYASYPTTYDGETNIGVIYYMGGYGIRKNLKKAIYWSKLAAKQGNEYGEYNIGFLYYNGEVIPKKWAEANFWYRFAAKQGNQVIKMELNKAYRYDYIQEDFKKAAYWYKLAAEQGDIDAQTDLGHIYYHGKGVPQNYKLAVYWYKSVAAGGVSTGQATLGYCYYKGYGVAKNYIKALKWFIIAKTNGCKCINKYINDIKHRLTASQIAEAKREAQEWRLKHRE
ncbi:MAG: hypothetical protein EVJ47_05250 [Candidatus Acidulodesulfobacterium ferriphilum]|uniref:Sel1 repeat family protein n=1 Tax=Candidatus Acidulodesulfobacterium ferriphilum TaxID=2597223 RepID=A0A519BBD0_9DELT|nr:MAG: hypothetical protein EVJ47_05250 [Candidatus Acidulodesulfobacterium ferriphilum]